MGVLTQVQAVMGVLTQVQTARRSLVVMGVLTQDAKLRDAARRVMDVPTQDVPTQDGRTQSDGFWVSQLEMSA